MGVLEQFFRISVLLTIMIIGINGFLLTFGTSLIDKNFNIGVVSTDPLTGEVSTSGTDRIEQKDVAERKPQNQNVNWDTMLESFNGMLFKYQVVVLQIFEDIDPTQSGADDEVAQVGVLLISIITMFQILGAAYVGFAVITAFFGGGSP